MPSNYRGIHITSILSKIAERLIAYSLSTFLERSAFSANQWAYRKKCGAKDLLAFLMCAWTLACCRGQQIGVYLSDISGAFDKVYFNFLLAKLRQLGLGEQVLAFFEE